MTVLAKPVVRQLFDQSLHFSMASRSRLLQLRKENERLERKLEEVRIVSRAKCLLIQHLGLTEDQAHRMIEKEAMDTRQTRLCVAQILIDEYRE